MKKEKDLGGNIKSDMYQHLSEVLSRIMQYYPLEGFDKFEEISNSVKQSNFYRAVKVLRDHELNTTHSKLSNRQALDFIEQLKDLFDEKCNMSEDDKGLLSKDVKFVIPDLMEQAKMLEWAGISFGQDQTYVL